MTRDRRWFSLSIIFSLLLHIAALRLAQFNSTPPASRLIEVSLVDSKPRPAVASRSPKPRARESLFKNQLPHAKFHRNPRFRRANLSCSPRQFPRHRKPNALCSRPLSRRSNCRRFWRPRPSRPRRRFWRPRLSRPRRRFPPPRPTRQLRPLLRPLHPRPLCPTPIICPPPQRCPPRRELLRRTKIWGI